MTNRIFNPATFRLGLFKAQFTGENHMRHSLWKNRGKLFIVMGLIGTLLAISNVSQAQVAVSGDLAVDNFAQVFTGPTTGIGLTLVGGVGGGPGTSWNYNFLTTEQHLYIAAWSDNSVQQGLLHDFTMDAIPVWSGDPAWEVYATGIDLNVASAVPTTAQLGTQIAIANACAGGAGTSVCWVATTVGGINDGTFPAGNPWVQQASIAINANWTWYDSNTQISAQAPFRGGFNHFEYLIFRTPVIPEPGAMTLSLVGLGLLGLLRRNRREVRT